MKFHNPDTSQVSLCAPLRSLDELVAFSIQVPIEAPSTSLTPASSCSLNVNQFQMKSTLQTSLTLAVCTLLIIQPEAISVKALEGPLPQPAERIRNEPESVWVEFIQLALDNKPLNLGQGFPDFAAPKYLVESLENATRLLGGKDIEYAKNVLHHQYTRSFGHPRLVRALKRYYADFRNFTKLQDEKQQILVTVGAYEALFVSLMAFVQPGDQVILIDPAFDAYAPIVQMAGGQSVFVPLVRRQLANKQSGDNLTTEKFELDMDKLGKLMSNGKSRVLVLNTPNNPLGKVFSRKELEQIALMNFEQIANRIGRWQQTAQYSLKKY